MSDRPQLTEEEQRLDGIRLELYAEYMRRLEDDVADPKANRVLVRHDAVNDLINCGYVQHDVAEVMDRHDWAWLGRIALSEDERFPLLVACDMCGDPIPEDAPHHRARKATEKNEPDEIGIICASCHERLEIPLDDCPRCGRLKAIDEPLCGLCQVRQDVQQ